MNDELNEKRVERDFSLRSVEEQQDFLSQTWCNNCMEVDLGMKNPKEYESESRVWIEGECLKCGEMTITEIVEED
ncbi:hypothetical protein OA92_22715 [Marinomonas sp. SBI22]|uniref:hypothetical protein n=1 Tax=unclassified Marinomonas TaxID=196814 RepID=UPI0005FA0037|nr:MULTISPECIES: hypothetical protein [unclassified Marinomonas]KJZ08866.1 hypothetical protein TW85_22750 [Marinomonas sp. S3726]KZM38615.1 hypothetical protein OA92_22715 [Marinomonas sp. SBI22]KZM39159.1 hypothetical protein OA91_22565 [Marinomonas sp. SBI8L]